ncbi:GNAT family N-acetyltransferase [Zongyangia hominis]|uniref:GNAT family N-acetyltransferase n=1 Tax=Zongyangia hominis TaxID=2763677 RepID=UPI0021CC7A1D|nr:GNAT family N-acetyltransferase [Zongyangia hominis]
MEQITYRLAREADAGRLAEIYAPYVRQTAITFEYEAPDVDEFARRIKTIGVKYPYLVCETEGEIAGYAYASAYRDRTAFQWSAELSVYLDPRFHRKGIATGLYRRLLALMEMLGYYTVYGVITLPNEGSLKLHENFGFSNAGVWHNCGYKLGHWRDVICLERHLRPFGTDPRTPLRMEELSPDKVSALLQ